MAKVCLVTVLFNSNDVLEGFFKSLAKQTYTDYHLYIIDNTPSQLTTDLIAEYSVKYPLSAYTHIINTDNVGVAKGNNQGTIAGLEDQADYILLLNNDIEFEQEDLIERMVATADKQNEHITIPKIKYFDSRKIWMAGGKILKYRGVTIHVGQDQDDAPEYNVPRYFDYAPTCFALISRDVFEKIGLMDEKYFVYYDDTDFMLRANKSGYKVFYMPDLEVLHKVSSSTGGEESLFSIFYGNRNRIYFISKNISFPQCIITFSYTFLTRMAKYIKYNSEKRSKMISGLREGFKLYYSSR